MFFVTIVSGFLSDKLIQSKLISRIKCRKLFNTIGNNLGIHFEQFLLINYSFKGLTAPMLAVVGLYFVDCSNPYLAIYLIVIGIGMK